MTDELQSLRRQLADAEENLRLLQERKAKYVLEVDIPLQLIRDERRLEAKIADLRGRLEPLAQAQLDADMESLRAKRDQADEVRREMRERQRVVNLRPLDVTHTFKDRVREAQALCKHLADGSVRLVSVVGRGGMGKTALVSRVLGDLERGMLTVPGEDRELHISGILYLSARSTGLSLERVYADVRRMLGEPTASRLAARWADRGTTLAAKVEYLLETMQDGLYLILLDNLEDTLDNDGTIKEEGLRLFVENCVTMPGGAQLIATSREQIKVAAAALHGARSILLCEGLPEQDAVTLLRNLDPDGALGLRDVPEDDLRRAVRLTQGIPRALEILVGILYEDPTTSLPELLIDGKLFGEQVVEQLVAEGYRRLGDDERRIMEALAVFEGPVEETAIVYLLHPWYPGLDVRAGLCRLARGYFVSASRITGEYSLHPLDRDYIYGQLPDPPTQDLGPDAYTRRNLELCAAGFYASIRKPEGEWKSIEDLVPQLAEFEHRVRAGDYDGAGAVLEPIDADYMYLWGHCTRLVELREKLLGQPMDLGLQAANLSGLGRAYRALGQVGKAIGHYEEALMTVRGIGDRRREGAILGRLGSARRVLGQFEKASELYEEALAIAREIGDRRREGAHLGHLGLTYRALGKVERAIDLYEEALSIAREGDDRRGEGVALASLGNAYYTLGQVELARDYHEEALIIAREISDRRGEGAGLFSLGSVHRALGQIERAVEYYQAALSIARETAYRRGEGIDLGYLGLVYRSVGQIERAIGCYEEALAIAREIGDRWNEGFWISNLGFAYCNLGQIDQAIACYEEALAIAREIGDRRGEDIQIGHLGHAYRVLGQVERAIALHREALVIAREIGNRWGESYQLLDLGKVLLATGEVADAFQCCQGALELNVPQTTYLAALMLGSALLHRHDPAAGDAYADAVTRCRARLERTANLFRVRYALATALVGQAICDLRWADESERAALLAPALAEYRWALENCPAKGVVQDAVYDLELIRAAGIKGLEPAFELLESALE